jgi:hypothetical protein
VREATATDLAPNVLDWGKMRSLRAWSGLLVALCLSLAACSSSSSVGSGVDDVKSEPSAQEIEALFRAVDDNCAGNDNGRLTKFDVAKFSATDAMAKLRAQDKDAMGQDCTGQRSLSTSRESGVKLFQDHISDKNSDTKSCLKQNLKPEQRARLNQIVSDPKNVGVFASTFGGGDNPEACDYFNFHIYRHDGTLIELTFNFTD